ncbi:hypothetical protein INT44_003121 [Umbelopsis vinacea]|uniref:Heterokaryon incompatibility domain-containing protein n=1 Tax=Umbelopsis vinacea TaxID=44442 RepID=A0A8H7UQ52_9FUNG|nr:hypothetical protein INT44_003121 [Umbelopsis vinacea]
MQESSDHEKQGIEYEISDEECLSIKTGNTSESEGSTDEDDYHLSQWYHAATDGNGYLVTNLINLGVDIGSVNQEGDTALHIAATAGHTEIVSILIKHGADIEVKDAESQTVLYRAAAGGYYGLVSLLIKHGASIQAKNYYSDTAIHAAAAIGNKKVVSLLLENGVAVDARGFDSRTILHQAAIHKQLELSTLLIEHGADVNATDAYLWTPLLMAVEARSTDIVVLLLSNGADVNARTSYPDTTLHMAASGGRKEMVSLLIDYGAYVNVKDRDLRTPLHYAAAGGHKEVVTILLDHGAIVDSLKTILTLLAGGAKIDQRLKDGNTIFAKVVEIGFIHMSTIILNNGASIETCNTKGQTPLLIAAEAGQLDMVSSLIDKGANIEAADNTSLTALQLAAKVGNIDLVDLLLRKGAQMEARTKAGNTALHIATKFNHSELAAFLIQHGAQIESRNNEGHTPSQVAIMQGHANLLRLLIDLGGTLGKEYVKELELCYLAADAGQIEAVKAALEKVSTRSDRDYYLKAILFRALRNKKPNVVLHLLDNGANIETKDDVGMTPLFMVGEDTELLSALIHRGANIEARNNRNQTVLHYYSSLGLADALRILLNCECDIQAIDDNGNAALHHAAYKNDQEVAVILIENGIDIDSKNSNGETTLHIAMHYAFLELADLLIDCGIDIHARTYLDESTAFHVAVQKQYTTWLSALLNRYSDVDYVNVKDAEWRTLLHDASLTRAPTMVKLLLGARANINALDIYGETALSDTILEAKKKRMAQILPAGYTVWSHGISKKRSPDKEPSRVLPEGIDEHNEQNMILKEFEYRALRKHQKGQSHERRLNHTKHKYGRGFPTSRMLQLADAPDIEEDDGVHGPNGGIKSSPPFTLFKTMSMDERAKMFIGSLFGYLGIRLYVSEQYIMLESNQSCCGTSPKWALQFDMIKGIVREPGRLIVHIPPKSAILSIPEWHRNSHPILCFIDAVYVCRGWSSRLHQDAFSDVLGGSETKLTTHLHAMLIAGLSVLSIASGHQLVDQLISAILNHRLEPIENSVPFAIPSDWQISNRIKCGCSSKFFHRPLSAVAAAKAVGIDIWRDRPMETVTRVWDLHCDALIKNIDATKVIFITHRWSDDEIEYAEIMERRANKPGPISGMSAKLRRIRDALSTHTRYVWMDAICIDKSNLSELDEAIRSMYKWYASCRAVVLDSGIPLAVWRERGWCLQEGAAAGVLCGISDDGNLVSIKQLAVEQKQELCTLDLHLYYRPGNAAEVLSRMDARATTRKEDMAYALTGILSVHLTLAYGEGLKSRERLLYELAIQKGDLSFLSFSTTKKISGNHLPAISDVKFLIARCVQAATPSTVSHLGISIVVQLISGLAQKTLLESLVRWKLLRFAKGKYVGIDEFIKEAEKSETKASTSMEVAIIQNIRSIMLVEIYGTDRQAGEGRPLKISSPIQCCQIEENEFQRLFSHISANRASYGQQGEEERLWITEDFKAVPMTKLRFEVAERDQQVNILIADGVSRRELKFPTVVMEYWEYLKDGRSKTDGISGIGCHLQFSGCKIFGF